MRWFKHFTDSRSNGKLKKVLIRYGAEGYATYWYCLEQIASELSGTNLTFELKHDAEVIGHELKVDSAKVEEIMRYMISIGLFEAPDTKRITCIKIAKYLEENYARSTQLKEIIRDAKHGKFPENVPRPSKDNLQTVSRQSQIVSARREEKRKDNYYVEKKLLDHLNEKAHKHFRGVDTNLRLIRARLKSGVTEDQVRSVIDAKVREWMGTEWEKFLRPKTLFTATNFENYLEGANKPQPVREWL